MRVTLIYSGIGVAGFDNNRPIGDREGSWIGHGIASIGAQVYDLGYDVNFIDLRQLSGFEEFEQTLEFANVFGISISAVDYYPALMTANIIKKKFPESIVVVGGIHPSIHPEKYLIDIIDCIVIGEGEITFHKILSNLNTIPKIITGIQPDLNKISFVKRDLFNYENELNCSFTPWQKLPAITMLAGRGCPYKCTYCQPAENKVFGKPFRIRNVENIINELELLKRYNYESITFWDDTFTFKKDWVLEFCKIYKEKINKPFTACSRADLICHNEEIIERMKDAGCDCLVIGFESGSQRLLYLVKKGTTIEQNKKAAKLCKKYDIKIFVTYMYGLPTETPEESRMTYNMMNEINPDFKSPFYFNPIEGTEIYELCDKKNLIIDRDRTVTRTGMFIPALNGIDYNYINELMGFYGDC